MNKREIIDPLTSNFSKAIGHKIKIPVTVLSYEPYRPAEPVNKTRINVLAGWIKTVCGWYCGIEHKEIRSVDAEATTVLKFIGCQLVS